LGALLRPEGPKFEAEGRERGSYLEEGSEPPPHQIEGLRERCKLSCSGVQQMYFRCTKSPSETSLVAANVV